jgi:hypothetical protein
MSGTPVEVAISRPSWSIKNALPVLSTLSFSRNNVMSSMVNSAFMTPMTCPLRS